MDVHQCRDRLSVAILQYVHQPRRIYLTHTSGNQPYVSLLDSRQQIRSGACGADGTCYDVVHQVTALIYNNPGCSLLHGKNIVETVSFNTRVRARWRAQYRYTHRGGVRTLASELDGEGGLSCETAVLRCAPA